jgi:hypothetical protein
VLRYTVFKGPDYACWQKWFTSYLPGYSFRYKEKIPTLDFSILLCKIEIQGSL